MKYKLSEVMDLIGGGTPKTTKPEYWDGDIPWLSVKDFNNDFRFVYETEKHITELGLNNSSTKLLKAGDVIISARGTVGEIATIPFPMAFNQSCYGLRAKKEIVTADFLYYLIKHNIHVLKKNTHGSVFDTITRDTFAGIEVDIPDMDSQTKIAEILSNIDEKIEVNVRINENLEQQISSIYANFCESKSWKPCELGSIIDVKDGTHDSPKPQTSGYLLVTSKHLLPYGVDRITPNRITEKDFKKINERSLVEQGDVLMSMIGTIGLISFVTEREIDYAIKNVALFKTSRTPNLAYYFLTFLKSNKTQQYIEMCLAGSTQKYISLGELRKMPIPVPDSETLECFNEIVSPMYQAIILNYKENYAFAALRDSLLPKLMSGEIDVSKIDI
ncbi:restriction endonuclease subunit S [Phascolarctobacterium succinatutens]